MVTFAIIDIFGIYYIFIDLYFSVVLIAIKNRLQNRFLMQTNYPEEERTEV